MNARHAPDSVPVGVPASRFSLRRWRTPAQGRDDAPGGHRSGKLPTRLLALPLAVIAALVVLAINESSASHSLAALQQLEQRELAMDHLDTVVRRMLDIETAQRGYLLTARKPYLAPAERAGEDVALSVAALRAYYGSNPAVTAQLDDWEVRARGAVDALAQSVAAHESGQVERWRTLLRDEPAAERSLALARSADRLAAHEKAEADREKQGVLQTLATSRFGIDATAAVVLLGLLLVLRQTAALKSAQQRDTLALQAERLRLEGEVQARTADLRELARHLHTVRDDQSGQLATVLHEDLGALLTTAKLDVARLRRHLAGRPPELLDRLSHLSASFDSGIALKRRIIEDLRPSVLSNLGLVAALQAALHDFGERAHVQVRADLQPLVLSDNAQLAVYRLVQESLTNIAKYAHAKTVTVALVPLADARTAQVSVSDDGSGFDPQSTRPRSHGLMGMRYRIEAVGGTLAVTSSPGHGTCITATLPLAAAPPS